MTIRSYAVLFVLVICASCANKKDILYLQDAKLNAPGDILYNSPTIQPNDILKITVGSLDPELSIIYNRNSSGLQQSIALMQLEGYLVNTDYNIDFPILGKISTLNLTTVQLADSIKNKLISGGHLNDPDVSVRLINAKITILGEVNSPGTYNFTEQNITVMQALGYAGDLTINGKRDDILITREIDGVRKVAHINLTSSEFMKSPYYFVKPNDLIIVNPNDPRVKSSGFVGNVGTLATVISLVLSLTILITTR